MLFMYKMEVLMDKITLENLIEKVESYNPEGVELVKKAYTYAEELHRGQYRQSGEPYIIHPLSVAYILAEIHADTETLCAALLHDTLEDTKITKEEIVKEFGPTVALLVDGVTKLNKMNFSSKQAQVFANTRKIITGIMIDIRIIIIKIADRLHNMRTLMYKSEFKQKENAIETMDLFVPLANYIGTYRIKCELEDLSLKYLYPDQYKRIEELHMKIEEESRECLKEMLLNIESALTSQKIPNEIKIRIKNIYGIYKRLDQGYKISEIHDLLSLKIMVDTIPNCYQTLRIVHLEYKPFHEKFKDYIYNPKTNMYRSLHTTVFGEEDRLIQTQIRTFEMDKVASFGLTAYWDIEKGNARDIMQNELKKQYQFFKSLIDINQMFADNQEFVRQVKSELFSDKVYVYTAKGDLVELPKGSTIIDFAYMIHSDIGNTMTYAIVNDKRVEMNYILQNKDRVRVITDDLSCGPKEEWLDIAVTTRARKRIKEGLKKEKRTIES